MIKINRLVIVSITKCSNMIGYLQALFMAWSKLSDSTCPITNVCNRTGQIGQLSSQ